MRIRNKAPVPISSSSSSSSSYSSTSSLSSVNGPDPCSHSSLDESVESQVEKEMEEIGSRPTGEMNNNKVDKDNRTRDGLGAVPAIKKKRRSLARCRRMDGGTWRCFRQAAVDHSARQYHLDQKRSDALRIRPKNTPGDDDTAPDSKAATTDEEL